MTFNEALFGVQIQFSTENPTANLPRNVAGTDDQLKLGTAKCKVESSADKVKL